MTIKQEQVIATGVVLKQQPYKESDALVTIYFKDYGKLTLLAKGLRKLKSKNASALQTLTLTEVTFLARKGLSLLIKATSLNYYLRIKEDLLLEAYATYFLEFVLRNEEDNHPDLFIYDNLVKALEALELGYNYQLVYLLYNAFILKTCGVTLQVDHCVRCQSTNKIVAISLQDGGFVCQNCLNFYDRRLTKELLKAFRHLNKYSLAMIDQIKITEESLQQLLPIMDYYVDEFTGLSLKSRKFIRHLTNL